MSLHSRHKSFRRVKSQSLHVLPDDEGLHTAIGTLGRVSVAYLDDSSVVGIFPLTSLKRSLVLTASPASQGHDSKLRVGDQHLIDT
jgi:hypothetical protein